MKILLIQSWLGRSNDLRIYPIGLSYLATVLEDRGYEIQLYDPNTADQPLEATARVVREYAPDVVGISLRNLDNQLRIAPHYYYKGFQQTAAVVRQACGDRPIVVGGAGFSILPRLIMERNPAIDLGLDLEAEESFPELLENMDAPARVLGVYYRENNEVHYTGRRALPDFASMPYPKRHFLDLRPYMRDSIESVGVQSKRGCPLTCAYCVYPHLNGKRWRMRTPEHVLEEVEYLRSNYNIRRITFADSVVNLPYEYSTRIFTLLKEHCKGLEWLGYMHVQGVTREYLQLCVDSGCTSVIFSPDGLSRGALHGLQKNLTPEDIWKLKKIVDTDPAFTKLIVQWCFFINPPGETLAGLLQTLWFFFKSKRFFGKRTRDAFINWIRIEPFSAVYRQALEQGVITPETDLLPEDPALLAHTFYSGPNLRWADPLVMALLRAPKRVRRVLGKFRR